MKTNIKPKSVKAPVYTHEGAVARKINAEYELRRSVLATFLGENQFYESGQSIEDRIASLVPQVKPEIVSQLAIEARNKFYLRHVPLLLVKEMLKHQKHKAFVALTLDSVIQRPDEIGEMLALYWKDGKCPIANQLKKGLANAFHRFNEFQLAKYDGNNATVKLRDVMFLTHPRPRETSGKFNNRAKRKKFKNDFNVLTEQENLFRNVAQRTLETPNTWEVRVSEAKGKNVKGVWESLLQEKALGGLAFLRNLRNMVEAGVNSKLIKDYFETANFAKVLPFRFIAALNHAVSFHKEIEAAMLKALDNIPKIDGKTLLLVDVSGSMNSGLSSKSDLTRKDAAIALAILVKGIFKDVQVCAFGNDVVDIPLYYSGFALRDAVNNARGAGGGTQLGKAVNYANDKGYERLIVLTDEQSADKVNNPLKGTNSYMINVASAKNGVGYGPWVHIDGFSESVLTFIAEYERLNSEKE